jgi:hypothetical protein
MKICRELGVLNVKLECRYFPVSQRQHKGYYCLFLSLLIYIYRVSLQVCLCVCERASIITEDLWSLSERQRQSSVQEKKKKMSHHPRRKDRVPRENTKQSSKRQAQNNIPEKNTIILENCRALF